MAIYTTRSKRFRAGVYSLLLCAAALVLVILFNLIVGALPAHMTRFDTSAERYYEISEASRDYLAALDTDVTLYLIAETNGEDTVVSNLLSGIAGCSPRVKVQQIDPALYPAFAEKYTSDKIEPNAVIVVGARRSAVVHYNDLFYDTGRVVTAEEANANPHGVYRVESTEQGEVIYEVTSHYAGESRILSAIDYTVTARVPKVCFVTGHGERELEKNYLDRLDLENIKPAASPVSLLTSTAIPEDCDLLMICYPKSDFSSVEIGFLRSYLSRGGAMMLMTNYAADLPNLFSLTGDYGMTYRDGVVLESSSAHYAVYPFYLLPQTDASLAEIPVLVGSHAIETPGAAGVQVTALYTSTEGSYLKDPAALTASAEKGSDDPLGPFTLGALAEKEEDGSAICWIASLYFAHSNCDAISNGVNQDAFLSLAARLTARESSLPLSVKTVDSGILAVGNSAAAGFWGVLLIGLLPAAAIVSGIVIWVIRRKR